MTDKKKRPGFFTSIWRTFRLLQLLLRGALAVAGGWLAYSKFVIPHKLTLPHALGGERRTFTANGLELSYYVSGDGKPLVLLHSINAAASTYEMKPIYDQFAASRRVYALDLPGFGFSARPDIAYSPAVYRDAILGFVREQMASGQGPVDAVALSLSCEFAALAAHAEPELFRSLTFISPSGFYSRPAAGGAQSRGQSDRAYS
jgi:pimeloyl-ACP methyl ester carboxylesterase